MIEAKCDQNNRHSIRSRLEFSKLFWQCPGGRPECDDNVNGRGLSLLLILRDFEGDVRERLLSLRRLSAGVA